VVIPAIVSPKTIAAREDRPLQAPGPGPADGARGELAGHRRHLLRRPGRLPEGDRRRAAELLAGALEEVLEERAAAGRDVKGSMASVEQESAIRTGAGGST
jgi:hypothetical protein